MARKSRASSKSIVSILVAAALSVLLGVALAGFSLMSHRVPELTSIPADPVPGELYYLKGSIIDSPGWSIRANAVMAGAPGSYSFSEGDLNAWARAHIKPPPRQNNEGMPLATVSDFPNLRIRDDGRLHLMFRVEFPSINPGRTFTYQTFGKLSEEGFHPSKGWIGACPLPLVNSFIFKHLASRMDVSEEARAFFSNIPSSATVALSDGALTFSR